MKKLLKLISSRILFLFLGISLALTIFVVRAAWDTTYNSGDTLTSVGFNDIVNKLASLDNFTSNMIVGRVAGSGAVLSGSGFTVTRTAVGRYTIDFDTPFVSSPSIVATAVTRRYIASSVVNLSQVLIKTWDESPMNGYTDIEFSFIAMGF